MNDRNDPPWLLRRRGSGYCLDGPGWYLWDEDPRQVLDAAAELRQGRVPLRTPERMLILSEPDDESGEGAGPR